MSPSSPFDHRPDVELGGLLREALAPGDEGVFTSRVVAAAEARHGASALGVDGWQVLGTWARPGLAAALGLAAGATIWLAQASTRSEVEVTLEEVFRATAEAVVPPLLVASGAPPSFDRVLGSSLEP
jgi:hypothetical protein